ncbi:acyl-CoA/acyl-ACP dehydrogenase [Streptomyces sp. NBC_00237]|uniref:acyl-CoA dehydrogenase family protein n=1 Tax=Streptomyces sp. NBC_00237 TaxID=2975687 RepID=UPI00225B5D59|nr:acyl-CoA dehydrogenase family protein [Streptomyces sp. NBC_00237]MCX5201853.1 acyl-CoA/acyl-ACP dehydrogenase [Streptomyces sp. NBC_00237]
MNARTPAHPAGTLNPTEEQEELRVAVRSVLARHEGPAAWQPLTRDIGVAALAIPEEYGGLGCEGRTEVHVVMEELGRALSPVPYLGSAVLATEALIASGNDEVCARLLPSLAEGASVAALAWAEADGENARGTWEAAELTAYAEESTATGDWLLTGTKEYVPTADAPDVLLALARTPGGLALFEVPHPEGLFLPLPAMDRTRPLGRIVLDATAARLISTEGARIASRVRDLAITALAAEQVGAAARALEITVQYAKDRVQFGRPIGSFQAVKHRIADAYVLLEAARSLALAAADSGAAPGPAAAAKAACSQAYQHVSGEMIQLHGGIGITWEHPAHDFFKRAHGTAHFLGSPDTHRARLAKLLGFTAASRAEVLA